MINILTLSWNGLDKLQRLRAGLLKNLESTKLPYRWYVRDNGSKDNSVNVLKEWPEVELLEAGHNRDNFAKGVNSLLKLIKQDGSVLLLNNDVEFTNEDTLVKMLSLLKGNVGAVGLRLLYRDSNQLQHAGVIFGNRYGGMCYHYRHKEISDPVACMNRYFQAVTAAVCLFHLSDLKAVNGLDEGFSWAFEDIDLCLRLGQLNKKIVYCGESFAYHEESATLKKNPVNKMFLTSNVKLFKDKWWSKYELDHEKYLSNPNYLLI